MSKFHISIKKSILILGGTQKVSFQVGISRVVGPEILGGTLNPPAHYEAFVAGLAHRPLTGKDFVGVWHGHENFES